MVVPVPRRLRTRAAATVFLSDPEATAETRPETLQRLFKLTPAEARLAASVGEGSSLAEAANQLGIGRETARTHLKRIFSKTGTRRQSELVRLLVGGVLGHVRPGEES